jgi:hypothetical protein
MKTLLFLLLTLLSIQVVQATHLLGGYIQAKPVAGSGQTYEVTLVLYMQSSPAADQADSYNVCFGDGSSSVAPRQSRTFSSDKTLTINTYRITHNYAGPGTYTLTATVLNRTIVKNITNAETQLFAISTTITTTTPNQSPTPGLPSSGFRIGANQKATLSLKATDADGDSLVYGLAKALTGSNACSGQVLSSYRFPNDLTQRGIFKLNNRTGDLVWDAPTELGYYSTALTINEYRNGNLISQTTQEITLIVDDLPGTPSAIPPYEPAIEGTFGGIVTATTSYPDSDILLTTFPSPVDDRLQVVIQSSNPTTATVQLTDLNGRKLHELSFNRAGRQHEQVISMSSLTTGFYVLQAEIGGRILVRKIMKR